MNKGLKSKIGKWRKTVLFFAAFVFVSTGTISCKKKFNNLGKDVLPHNELMSSDGVDTFQVFTYTVMEDSVNTMDPEFNLLGSYNDEYFGQVEASFYTQLTLSGFSPEFGDMSTLVIDSAVMAFEYGGYYGKLNEQLFEVYEVTEEMTRDSSYTRTSSLEIDPQNIVLANHGLITPNTERLTYVGQDTLNPQLRIQLDKDFAKSLLETAETSASDADFLENFKGLYFKTNNPTFAPGEGSILYLETSRPASKLTVYYHNEADTNKFDFIVTKKPIDFNKIEVDYSGTKVGQVVENNELGQVEYYTQAFVSRGKIDFPSINGLPKNVIIHKATLEVPVSYYEGDPHYISGEIVASAELFEDDERKYLVSTVPYDKTKRAYVIDLRTYIQNILKGEIVNKGIYISPKMFNTTMERILFNGAENTNKKQPKLNIVYTKL